MMSTVLGGICAKCHHPLDDHQWFVNGLPLTAPRCKETA